MTPLAKDELTGPRGLPSKCIPKFTLGTRNDGLTGIARQ
jgi:hypothetical protein